MRGGYPDGSTPGARLGGAVWEECVLPGKEVQVKSLIRGGGELNERDLPIGDYYIVMHDER